MYPRRGRLSQCAKDACLPEIIETSAWFRGHWFDGVQRDRLRAVTESIRGNVHVLQHGEVEIAKWRARRRRAYRRVLHASRCAASQETRRTMGVISSAIAQRLSVPMTEIAHH